MAMAMRRRADEDIQVTRDSQALPRNEVNRMNREQKFVRKKLVDDKKKRKKPDKRRQLGEKHGVSIQCQAKKADGSDCTRRTLATGPNCWQHTRLLDSLRVAKSTIRNAGNGLFAWDKTENRDTVVFRKGEVIIEYYGEHTSNDADAHNPKAKADKGSKPLIFDIPEGQAAEYTYVTNNELAKPDADSDYGGAYEVINSWKRWAGVARYANDADALAKTNRNNARLENGVENFIGRVFLIAERDIKHGEEIFAEYEEGAWEGFQEELDEKELILQQLMVKQGLLDKDAMRDETKYMADNYPLQSKIDNNFMPGQKSRRQAQQIARKKGRLPPINPLMEPEDRPQNPGVREIDDYDDIYVTNKDVLREKLANLSDDDSNDSVIIQEEEVKKPAPVNLSSLENNNSSGQLRSIAFTKTLRDLDLKRLRHKGFVKQIGEYFIKVTENENEFKAWKAFYSREDIEMGDIGLLPLLEISQGRLKNIIKYICDNHNSRALKHLLEAEAFIQGQFFLLVWHTAEAQTRESMKKLNPDVRRDFATRLRALANTTFDYYEDGTECYINNRDPGIQNVFLLNNRLYLTDFDHSRVTDDKEESIQWYEDVIRAWGLEAQ